MHVLQCGSYLTLLVSQRSLLMPDVLETVVTYIISGGLVVSGGGGGSSSVIPYWLKVQIHCCYCSFLQYMELGIITDTLNISLNVTNHIMHCNTVSINCYYVSFVLQSLHP